MVRESPSGRREAAAPAQQENLQFGDHDRPAQLGKDVNEL
jgi:hypothetical protein